TGTGDTSTKDTTADTPADLAVAINDGAGFVNATEAGVVSYTVSGLDADATATVTFSDGNPLHDVVSGRLCNGPATANRSRLRAHPITATITTTAAARPNATGTGDTSTKDTTADTPADLAVAINDGDGFVNATEAGVVSYTVSGLDADATATVTFSDGN